MRLLSARCFANGLLRTCPRQLCGLALSGWLITAAPVQALNSKQVYRYAAPAVVVVIGSTELKSRGATGSGSIIRSDGYILTNRHVVMDDYRVWPSLRVALKPKKITGDPRNDLSRTYPATVVTKIDGYDLAILKIDVPDELPYLLLSDLSMIGIGEDVIAIGHPGRGGKWSMTRGQISGSFERYEGMEGRGVFQTYTAINPGNSGGPLLDASGRIVGINTFGFSRNRHGDALEGLNFAIKSTTAIAWIQEELGHDFLPTALPPGQPQDDAPAARAPETKPTGPPSLEPAEFESFLDELRGAPRPAPKAPPKKTAPTARGFDQFLQELGTSRQQQRQDL